ETVWQHAFRNGSRPFDENVARVRQATGREAKATYSDERIATPVGEPRIAGNDRASRAAADQVRIGGAVDRLRESCAPAAFRRPCVIHQPDDRIGRPRLS